MRFLLVAGQGLLQPMGAMCWLRRLSRMRPGRSVADRGGPQRPSGESNPSILPQMNKPAANVRDGLNLVAGREGFEPSRGLLP
jgi:hypothetical protein